jgi:diacylglycerol kinase
MGEAQRRPTEVERVTRHRSWVRKFADAFRGVAVAVHTNTSFWVHLPCAALVVVAGLVWNLEAWQWAVIGLCITMVLTAELLNTALEELAKAVDPTFNPHVRDALDVASGAVLMAALGAVALGALVFLL